MLKTKCGAWQLVLYEQADVVEGIFEAEYRARLINEGGEPLGTAKLSISASEGLLPFVAEQFLVHNVAGPKAPVVPVENLVPPPLEVEEVEEVEEVAQADEDGPDS